MGASGNFWLLQHGLCGEYNQLLFLAHSAGEQKVIIIIKFIAESMWPAQHTFGMLLMHLQPPQCPETPNMQNSTQ